MKSCPRCNHEVQEDQAECPECGVVFAQWDAAHTSSPISVSPLKRVRTAAWILVFGSIAGIILLPTGLYSAILLFVLMLDVIVLIVLRAWIRKRATATLPPASKAPPTLVSPPVPASGRFTPRHQKYLGLVLVILGVVLMGLASGKFWTIGWLLGGIGLAIYAKGRGHSLAFGLVPYGGPLIGLLVFAKDNNKEERTILIDLVLVAIIGILTAVAMPAYQAFYYREGMYFVQAETVTPILTALEKYYQKNGRFPVSTTATTVTPSMSGALDKGPDVWTSMGSDRYPIFHNTARGSLVSQLDYTSDVTGSTMTLTLTMANFGTDSINGKIISVTPSPEKETAITWSYNCSSGIDPVVSKHFKC